MARRKSARKAKSKKRREVDLVLETHLRELGFEFITEHKFALQLLGRNWKFDYAVVAKMIAIEIEGGAHKVKNEITGQEVIGHHHHQEGFQSDLDKYNVARSFGWTLYRFSTRDVLTGRAKCFLEGRLPDDLLFGSKDQGRPGAPIFMSRKSSPDWIVSRDSGETALCQRCGRSASVKLPMPLSMWCEAMKEFVRLHRGCKDQGGQGLLIP